METIDVKKLANTAELKMKIELLEAKNDLTRAAILALIEHGEKLIKAHPERDGILYPVSMIKRLKDIYESSK